MNKPDGNERLKVLGKHFQVIGDNNLGIRKSNSQIIADEGLKGLASDLINLTSCQQPRILVEIEVLYSTF
jgi:hypothetical protein